MNDEKWAKRLTIALVVLEILWVILLACAGVAVFDAITSFADEPKVIINGVYQTEMIDIQEAPPIDDISTSLDEQDAKGNQLQYLGKFFTTYYCPCKRCNGSNAGIDGFGNPLEWGCVAVDRNVIPLHTKLVIDGYDMVFEARDTGSNVDGHKIDIFVPVSHNEALAMCKDQWMNVWKYTESGGEQ